MDISSAFAPFHDVHINKNMKTKVLGLCFTGVACLLLAACASGPAVSVATDYNHQISFAGYKTYWLDLSQAPELQSTGRAALVDALRTNLAQRGITEAPAKQADLVVVPAAFTSEKLHSMPTRNTTYVPYRGGQYGTGLWYMNSDVTQYTEGTLVLDFLDRKRHLIVFRGSGKGVLSTQERNAVGIQDAVHQIIAQMPR
jgi:hypothetical protein